MMNLLVLRERLKSLYQKSEMYINPIAKFLMAFIIFSCINQTIGFDERLDKLVVVVLLSLVSAFLPVSIIVLLAAILMIGHIYFLSKVLSIITILLLFILYFLFLRFTPNLGLIVLAVPVLFILKIPYVVPIILGLVCTPVSIIPASCGVIVYYFVLVIKNTAITSNNIGIDDTLQLYTLVVNSLMNNKQMLLSIVVFAIVIIAVYLVSKLEFDHIFDIAIITGLTVNVLGFLIGDLMLDVSDKIVEMILGTIFSTIIVYIFQFFRLTLDYTAIEKVQFEDDDYYYYVKAVPKINVTVPEKNIKRINRRSAIGDTEKLDEVIHASKTNRYADQVENRTDKEYEDDDYRNDDFDNEE
ncbi:hypothetical protein [Anaeromicropila herbilytica]|uniref:Uncharacterized protein n=1 Tax=Anaeromicropila herbilytica TaxID=2785025 RepID=A0A7R7EJE2_9FIRM|nr:hypothetical protein [Anaeromicropila herbilytica]BCN29776.1 hypothetical protein bsdtb5_10710 [Anaeromicropila herbilytica]